jgi:hypothetical protein
LKDEGNERGKKGGRAKWPNARGHADKQINDKESE